MKKIWTIKSSPSVASSRAPPTSENSPKLLHFRSTQFVRHQYLHQFSSGRWATDLEKRMMCAIPMQERNMIFCSLLSPPRKYEKSWWLLGATGLISAERQHESSGLPLHPHLKPPWQYPNQSLEQHPLLYFCMVTCSQLPPIPHGLKWPLYVPWSCRWYPHTLTGGMEETFFSI